MSPYFGTCNWLQMVIFTHYGQTYLTGIKQQNIFWNTLMKVKCLPLFCSSCSHSSCLSCNAYEMAWHLAIRIQHPSSCWNDTSHHALVSAWLYQLFQRANFSSGLVISALFLFCFIFLLLLLCVIFNFFPSLSFFIHLRSWASLREKTIFTLCPL